MKYKKFFIRKYRSITRELTINIDKESLIPIIGVNECGKTTILHAIFAFDHFNDDLNQGRHLENILNLYRTDSTHGEIGAEIQIGWEKFKERMDAIINEENNGETANLQKEIRSYKRKLKKNFPDSIFIFRNLKTKKYNIENDGFNNEVLNDLIAKKILTNLPYILYFDDFRDSIEEKIEIKKDEKGEVTGWLSILERLFKKTNSNYSVFNLKDAEDRQRKGILAKVKKSLNKTLTKEWQNFRLDDRDALQISIEYLSESEKQYLKLEVIEVDSNNDEHFFFISDRSKGFYWFFNFVMKLEFNPKVLNTEGQEAIYLLDEPGSYLHASAQEKLCNKLKELSADNKVIYCTHSHYLLNPEVIPLSRVKIADKDGTGNIELLSIYNYKGNITDKRSAFQPIADALQIKPFLIDFSRDKVIISEGITDYYALNMLKGGHNVSVLPSVNADSIKFYISLMIAWRIDYRALWDNDKAGRAAKKEAEKYFGRQESEGKFFLLPHKRTGSQKTILQDYFEGSDIKMIKEELTLPQNTSFEKMMPSLFYSENRTSVLNGILNTTKKRFLSLLEHLKLTKN